uniref:Ig-like domain-containing protein n=1 Tax=Macrostomum lignano TaxID=282301 RepID=A0A1I8FJM0_9PLAT
SPWTSMYVTEMTCLFELRGRPSAPAGSCQSLSASSLAAWSRALEQAAQPRDSTGWSAIALSGLPSLVSSIALPAPPGESLMGDGNTASIMLENTLESRSPRVPLVTLRWCTRAETCCQPSWLAPIPPGEVRPPAPAGLLSLAIMSCRQAGGRGRLGQAPRAEGVAAADAMKTAKSSKMLPAAEQEADWELIILSLRS